MTITVGVPALGPAAWPFVESLVALELPPGEARRLMIAGPLAVDAARNQIVRRFLAAGAQHTDGGPRPAASKRKMECGDPSALRRPN